MPKIIEGWERKPNGLLQVLWERGWIDNTDNKAYQKYTISGWKNEFNLVQPETSLKHLMSSCTNSEKEETMLQLMATLMHIQVDQSPKCHCEVAGNGIKNTWACNKNHHWCFLLEQKHGKEKIMNIVRLCMTREGLTREKVQKNAKRVRRYILGYNLLWKIKQGIIQSSDSQEDLSRENKLAVTPSKLEQMVKKFKAHRCAMDFDHSFIKAIVFLVENIYIPWRVFLLCQNSICLPDLEVFLLCQKHVKNQFEKHVDFLYL